MSEGMSDSDFVRDFEACSLPEHLFHHADHIRLTWIYLQRHPLPAAFERVCTGIRRFAASLGKADRYHETITVAYVLLVQERLRPDQNWAEFRENNPELFSWNPSILDRYYTPERLKSDRARKVFVWPDRQP